VAKPVAAGKIPKTKWMESMWALSFRMRLLTRVDQQVLDVEVKTIPIPPMWSPSGCVTIVFGVPPVVAVDQADRLIGPLLLAPELRGPPLVRWILRTLW
jgi:hypothetical protein